MQKLPANPDPENLVLIKAPGGGSISHQGIEYCPDQNGNVLIPRSLADYLKRLTFNSDPRGGPRNASSTIRLEEVTPTV
jgi:hypothetical protein